jgi:hypothetical protein
MFAPTSDLPNQPILSDPARRHWNRCWARNGGHRKWLVVASRMIVRPFYKQMRMQSSNLYAAQHFGLELQSSGVQLQTIPSAQPISILTRCDKTLA